MQTDHRSIYPRIPSPIMTNSSYLGNSRRITEEHGNYFFQNILQQIVIQGTLDCPCINSSGQIFLLWMWTHINKWPLPCCGIEFESLAMCCMKKSLPLFWIGLTASFSFDALYSCIRTDSNYLFPIYHLH